MKRLGISLLALIAAGPLAAQDFALDEIVITANRETTEASRTGASFNVVTEADLNRSPNGSVAGYFRRLPGVTVRASGPIGTPATLLIRGASQNYIGTYVDGIDVSDPSATQTAFDFGQLTTLGLSRAEVIKGSQSAIYGAGAVAGVVSFTTARAQEDGFHQTLQGEVGSYNTRLLSYTATFRDARTEAAFTLGRITTDGFSNASEALGNTERDAFETSRLSFYLAHRVTDGVEFGLNGFWEDSASAYDPAFYLDPSLAGRQVAVTLVDFRGDDDILIPLGDGGTSDERLSRETAGLRFFANVSSGAVDHRFALSTFRIDRNYFENELAPDYIPVQTDCIKNKTLPCDYGTLMQTTDATYSGRRVKAEWTAAFDLGAGRMNLGAAWTRDALVQFGDFGSADDATFTRSLFGEYLMPAGDATDVAISGRLDRHSLFGNLATVRLAVAHRLNDATVLRFQAGSGFRAPSNFELYSFYGARTLQPERSTNVDFGIEHEFASGATVKATAFYLEATDLIDYDFTATGCPAVAVFGPGCYAQIDGRSVRSGLELEASATIMGDLALTGAYTYTDSDRNAATSWARVARHKLSLGLEKPLADRLTGSMEITGEFDRPDWSDGTPAPDYAVAGAMLEYKFENSMVGYLRVENVFDEVYEQSQNYGTSRRAAYVGLRATF